MNVDPKLWGWIRRALYKFEEHHQSSSEPFSLDRIEIERLNDELDKLEGEEHGVKSKLHCQRRAT